MSHFSALLPTAFQNWAASQNQPTQLLENISENLLARSLHMPSTTGRNLVWKFEQLTPGSRSHPCSWWHAKHPCCSCASRLSETLWDLPKGSLVVCWQCELGQSGVEEVLDWRAVLCNRWDTALGMGELVFYWVTLSKSHACGFVLHASCLFTPKSLLIRDCATPRHHFPSRGLGTSVIPRSGAAVLLVCICCRQCEQPRVILPEPQRGPSEILGSHETQANLAFTCCWTHGPLFPVARHVVSSRENDQMDGKSCLVPLVVPFCFQSTLNSSITGIKPLSSGESGLPAGDQCP